MSAVAPERVLSEEQMEAAGQRIGAAFSPANAAGVLALVGNLGAGKTRFAKGVAKGLGFDGEVTSPTFTLAHEYRRGRFPMVHVDLYRLESEARLWEIGWEEWIDEPGLLLVEWADRFPQLFPAETLWLGIRVVSETERLIYRAGCLEALQLCMGETSE